VLYLAEVHKKSGFMGAKTELKLLARQQSEQNWSPLSGEEMVPVDAANDYNAGVLVMVDLDGNNQVRKVQDATRHLVGLMKNFSKMRDKFRSQEEEIEGWKQSLIYQSQELTRREVDIESRSEELQLLESEAQKIEQQRAEFEEMRAQILQLKEQTEQDRQQLEEGWGRLQQAQQEHNSHTALSDEQLQHLEGLMQRLESNFVDGEALRQPMQSIRSASDEQQSLLQQFWMQFDEAQSQAQQGQAELDQQAAAVEQGWQKWHQDQDGYQQLLVDCRGFQESLEAKKSQKDWLSQQIQLQQTVAINLQCLKDGISTGTQVDVAALQQMPIAELEGVVDGLRKELAKLSTFVSDQEEELTLQQETIEELRAKIDQASEYDRLSLASDLEYEQQNYDLLANTIQGQRQTLAERKSILQLHQSILQERQGTASDESKGFEKQLNPILQRVTSQKQSLEQSLAQLDMDLAALESSLARTQEQATAAKAALDNSRTALAEQSRHLENQRIAVGKLWGKVESLRGVLEPIQTQLQQQQSSISHFWDNVWSPMESAVAEQRNATEQLKQTVLTLGQASAAASQ
jgi:chromosome segregation ATPase